MKPDLIILLLFISTQVSLNSSIDNDYPPPPQENNRQAQAHLPNENNYPPPPDHQKEPSSTTENNYPPPQYNKPHPSVSSSYSENNKYSPGQPINSRDVRADSQYSNSHHSRGIDHSVGEREYTTIYRNSDTNDYYYYNNSNLTQSVRGLFVLSLIGIVIVYISIITICYAESNQVSYHNFINWLKQNPPQPNEEQYIPTNQLITIEGYLECLNRNSSLGILEIIEPVIQLKVIEETFEKHETTEKMGNQVTIKTKYVWSSSKDVLSLSNDIQFASHKLSKEALNQFSSVCEEFMALPTLGQINQFAREQKFNVIFNNIQDGYYYTNYNIAQPMVNDKRIRIFYRKIESNAIYSFLGSFNGLLFEPYITPIKKGNLNLLLCCFNVYNKYHSICHCSKEPIDFRKFIQSEEKSNQKSTIMLRIVGLVLYIVGNFLLMLPLHLLISVIPLIGQQLSHVLILISLFISVLTFVLIFVIAWFSARPKLIMLIGIIVLIVSTILRIKLSSIIFTDNKGASGISFSEAIHRCINYYFH